MITNFAKRHKAAWTLLCLVSQFACRSDHRVIIASKGGREHVIRVEIADTPAKRELGLQYRQELGDDQGMLFLFPTEAVQTFWMKNTPIPLDMIFIGGDRKIVGIVERATPFSTATRSVGAASQFVLEIKGGLASAKGIEVGNSVRFEGISVEGIKE